MSEKTKIEWCDSTLNFWSGCTKVSAGCARCYAEALSDRKLTDAKGNLTIGRWGKGAPRKLHESAFKQALALNRKPWVCGECGAAYTLAEHANPDPTQPMCSCMAPCHRRRIFSLSLGDWLDDEVPIGWLAEMLDTIRQCDQVNWILCTKRPELWSDRLHRAMREACGPADFWISGWLDGHPPKNIILLASVENQEAAEERVPALLKIPAASRGLSLEPLLGQVDLTRIVADESTGVTFNALTGYGSWNKDRQCAPLDWLILGGESGPGARLCNVEWIRSLVAQGKAAGVATFVKQFGAMPYNEVPSSIFDPSGGYVSKLKLADKKGGDWSEWPADLRVREWPL